MVLQFSIIVTGNYNFFNLLTIALLLKSWEEDKFDKFEDKVLSSEESLPDDNSRTDGNIGSGSGRDSDTNAPFELTNNSASFTVDQAHFFDEVDKSGPFISIVKAVVISLTAFEKSNLGIIIQYLMALGFIFFSCWRMLYIYRVDTTSLDVNNYDAFWEINNIALLTKYEDIEAFIEPICVSAIVLCCSGVLISCLMRMHFLLASPDGKKTDGLKAFWECLLVLCMAVTGVIWICVAAVPLGSFFNVTAYLPPGTIAIYRHTQRFQVVSGYGLFRQMTGVAPSVQYAVQSAAGTAKWKKGKQKIEQRPVLPPSIVARPEIIVEGFDEDSSTWKEIPFMYKPTSVYQVPPWVAPHQPRLDWQMWFAALGTYHQNPWFIHLIG